MTIRSEDSAEEVRVPEPEDQSDGRGTTFTVLLPPSAAPARPVESAFLGETLGGNGVVLVVEDEGAVRRVAKVGLEAYGYTVTLAENGKEALEQLERLAGRVDLVLLDLAMPVMDGEETMREIQRLYPDVAVVVMTGLGDFEAMNQLRGLGISGFLEKPFTPEHLATEVKRAIATGARGLDRRVPSRS